MFNSKLKLQGLSLDEIIHEGVFGNNPEVSIDDWKYIEYLLTSGIDSAYKLGYDSRKEQGQPEDVYHELTRAPQGSVQLIQDDWCEDDSTIPEALEVCLAGDSDMHVRAYSETGGFLRFRNMIGGGKYPNTHFALRNLYDAMVEDSKLENDNLEAWGNAARRYGNIK